MVCVYNQSGDGTYNQNYNKNELMEEKVGNSIREGYLHYNPCYASVVKNTRTTAPLHFQVRILNMLLFSFIHVMWCPFAFIMCINCQDNRNPSFLFNIWLRSRKLMAHCLSMDEILHISVTHPRLFSIQFCNCIR